MKIKELINELWEIFPDHEEGDEFVKRLEKSISQAVKEERIKTIKEVLSEVEGLLPYNAKTYYFKSKTK
jgi:hypothetical protein